MVTALNDEGKDVLLVVGLMEPPSCLDGDTDLRVIMGIIMTVMGW